MEALLVVVGCVQLSYGVSGSQVEASTHRAIRAEARGDPTGAHGLDCANASGDSTVAFWTCPVCCSTTGGNGCDHSDALGDFAVADLGQGCRHEQWCQQSSQLRQRRLGVNRGPLLQFIDKFVDIPVVAQRLFPMLIPQLQHIHKWSLFLFCWSCWFHRYRFGEGKLATHC